jgi:predicted unusual protein kinase regulating ubiquinone biosynthesis (AarF/ABC1/UbiB family)
MIKTRYRRILWFFGLAIANFIWWDVLLPRIGLGQLARLGRQERLRKLAVSFRKLAIDMGGVMIKVGQFLSARLDILPRTITDELAGLQDEVQPESLDAIRTMIEGEFETELEYVFCRFEKVPMASASIGQVHRASLRDESISAGDCITPSVVVKVQRPNIETIVETDLAALRVVGGWVNRYPPVRKRANVPALLDEFSRSLYEEIDYLNEAKNAEIFEQNFANLPGVHIPKILWQQTTRRVLTLDDVEAIKITDYDAIEAAGIDRGEVAKRLFDMYLKQIFEDRFFHADPHPGNLFVRPCISQESGQTAGWDLIFVDFGMTGQINQNTFAGLREAAIAVGTQDAARLIKSYQLLNILLPGADLQLLEKATAQAFERFWGRTSPEIMGMGAENIREFAREFGALLYEMPFQLPENMILLGRCLSILNGICTGLDPDFNFWIRIEPYARRVLLDGESGSRWEVLLREIGEVVRTAITIPRRLDSLITKIEQGNLEVRSPEIKNAVSRLERSQRKLAWAVLCAAFLLAATQLFLAGHIILAVPIGLFALGALILVILR